MKVVDLHPEELIDKLATGELSQAERERLDAHLAQCSACRFEIGVRADLEREAPGFESRPQLTFPAAAERMQPMAGSALRIAASVRPRSRRRWPLVMLAAALVLCAGGATAAVITGSVPARWLHWSPEAKVAKPAVAVTTNRVTAKPRHTTPNPSLPVAAQPVAAQPVAAQPVAAQPVAAQPVAAQPVATTEASAASASPGRPAAVADAARAARLAKSGPVELAPGSARSLSNVAFPSPPAAPGSGARVEDSTLRVEPAAALFADANRARRDGNADRAMALYRSLQSRYPGSSESELSRALLAQLMLDRGNPEGALAGFDRYLAEGAPVLNAEALVGRARALEQLGKAAQAAAAWREVQSRFAGSVHARLAAARLAALGMR